MMTSQSQSIYVGDQQVLLQSDYQCAISSSNLGNVLINHKNSATNIIVTKLVSPKANVIDSVPSDNSKNSCPLDETQFKSDNFYKDNLVQPKEYEDQKRDNSKSPSVLQAKVSKLAVGSSVALCSMCGKNFSSNYNLKRHMSTCKQCPDHEKRSRHECHCGRTYSQEWDLKKHKAACRNVEKKCKKCIVSNCNLVFYHRSQLLAHVKKDHNMRVQDPETLDFASVADFMAWKEQEEERTCTYYSKQTGSNTTGVSINAYYICQHDGSERLHGSTVRKTERRNKKGRMKTGRVCWSQMNVKEFSNGTVKVTYFPSHTHPVSPSDSEHHPLPPSISSEIKRRLQADHSDEDAIYSEYPELKKSKKKNCNMNIKTMRALARKNRKLFRITAEAVEDAVGGKEPRETSEEACSESDPQRIITIIPQQEMHHHIKNEIPSAVDLIDACQLQWRQLLGYMESGKLSDSTLSQVSNALGSLLESCEAEVLSGSSNESIPCEQLSNVVYHSESIPPDVYPNKSELNMKPMEKTVYQVVTIAAKDEPNNTSPEELLAVEFPREFIIIAKDQILHSINPSPMLQ